MEHGRLPGQPGTPPPPTLLDPVLCSQACERPRPQKCLDLIGGKPLGLLPQLDEQTKLGRKVTDESYLATVLKAQLGSTPSHKSKSAHTDDDALLSKPMSTSGDDSLFTIRHFAGVVTYSA